MRLGRNVARVVRGEVLFGLWWKNPRKTDHGIPRCRWEDNIKMDIKTCDGVWTGLIWLRMGLKGADTCECHRKHSGF
jgi:hypothetical protein